MTEEKKEGEKKKGYSRYGVANKEERRRAALLREMEALRELQEMKREYGNVWDQ